MKPLTLRRMEQASTFLNQLREGRLSRAVTRRKLIEIGLHPLEADEQTSVVLGEKKPFRQMIATVTAEA